jgi:hypothetical protein
MRSLNGPLVVAVALVALVSTINVHAYRRATTRETTSFYVDTTMNATLSITTGALGAYRNGMLYVDFGRGKTLYTGTTATPAVARDTYVMRKVFTITNNSTSCYQINVHVPSGNVPNLTGIYGADTNGAGPIALAGGGGKQLTATTNWYNITANGSMTVEFDWTATQEVTAATPFQLKVLSQPRTCP